MINKIICGNAVEELVKLKTDTIDLIITSPPYFDQRKYIENNDSLWEIGQELSVDRYLDRLSLVFDECVRICKLTGSIVFNIGDKYINGCLQLIPYQFALRMINKYPVKLINEITWIKNNPTPRQYDRRLISSTEPFFHFVKDNNYYYNREEFDFCLKPIMPNKSSKKGQGYGDKIQQSNLTAEEKKNAFLSLSKVIMEIQDGKIYDFRMKIRGVHKKAFGGQSGGRNNQIDKQGYTIIRMYGNKIKRDIIEAPVANSKNIDHPAIFPLKVIKELVLLLSEENSLVLDPFCGSGQTCLAAKSLNRQYLGIDLNPRYCQIAEERLSDFLEK